MALLSLPVLGLTIGGEGIICCARAIAFGGSTGGGSVDCDRGEEVVFAVKLDEFVLWGFLTEASETAVSWTGDSCGDNSELMSISNSSTSRLYSSIMNDGSLRRIESQVAESGAKSVSVERTLAGTSPIQYLT